MCGRFTFATAPEVAAEFFGLDEAAEFPPRYNIAPTQVVPVVLNTESGRRLELFRWGLIPSWTKDPSIGNKMINARAETVAEKPAFRSAFKQRRCLMPADGFYEWQEDPKGKQPFHIRMRDGSPFAFAALWERWESGGATVRSCCILTTTPNEVLAPIHDRMPVILRRSDFGLWLDATANQPEKLTPLLAPYPPGDMSAFAVSTRVNSPARDDEECVRPQTP